MSKCPDLISAGETIINQGFHHIWLSDRMPTLISPDSSFIIVLDLDGLLPSYSVDSENSPDFLGTYDFYKNIFFDRCGIYINPNGEVCVAVRPPQHFDHCQHNLVYANRKKEEKGKDKGNSHAVSTDDTVDLVEQAMTDIFGEDDSAINSGDGKSKTVASLESRRGDSSPRSVVGEQYLLTDKSDFVNWFIDNEKESKADISVSVEKAKPKVIIKNNDINI